MGWKIFYGVLFLFVLLTGYSIYDITRSRAALANFPDSYAFGPSDADLTVVGFIDYNCEHCRDTHPVIIDAINKDGHVRYIPLPLITPSGVQYAAKLTYAADKQGKYREAYREIIENYRPINENDVIDIAVKIGIDPQKLKADALSKNVLQQADKSMETYLGLGGEITPTFFIGPDIMYVPDVIPSTEDFLRLFQEARGKRN